MSDALDHQLPAYRVEWRPNLITNWQRYSDAESHSAAVAVARVAVKKHGGQARAIVQHVFHREGIGS